jgi:uncharacterized protein with PIN domain
MEGVNGSVDAEYALEMAAACPQCKERIESVHVVRALRTKVNFVSSLPRRGQLIVCPECRTILGGALGGVI